MTDKEIYVYYRFSAGCVHLEIVLGVGCRKKQGLIFRMHNASVLNMLAAHIIEVLGNA
jgi:hypothetical protein